MAEWLKLGFLKQDLLVMKAGDEDFVPLEQRKEFANIEPGSTVPPKFEFASST